jgi:hypothetical protein
MEYNDVKSQIKQKKNTLDNIHRGPSYLICLQLSM